MQDQLRYPWGQSWQILGGSQDGTFAGQLPIISGTLEVNNTLFRGYLPGEGRWMSPDPAGGDISNPQSFNRYAYALNSPTTLIDPLGLDPCSDNGNGTVTCPPTTITVYGGTPSFNDLI